MLYFLDKSTVLSIWGYCSAMIRFTDYALKGCSGGGNSRITTSGSNKRDRDEDLQAANSLPIRLPEKNKEMFLSDLQMAIC
jgi:hypothetical protein